MDSRKRFIDASKGVGILLVVLGHTYGIPEPLYNIIYAFHMPLFFIISGWVYNEEKYNTYTFREIIIKKAKAYLIPYYIFAFLNLILNMFFDLLIRGIPVTTNDILNDVFGILYCYADIEHMPNCSPIWFLMCLFWASILFCIIIKYQNKYKGLMVLGCMFLSYLLYLFLDVRLPLNLATSFMAVFFMYIGYFIKRYGLTVSKISISILLLGIPIGLMNGGQVGMNGNSYGNIALFLLSATALSVLLLFTISKWKWMQNRFFLWLGRNTVLFIGFNYFVRDFTTEIYYIIPGVRNIQIHWITSFLLTVLGLIFLTCIWNRIKHMIFSDTN